ncbi:voltage-gated potassium channel [Flavobacterium arsenatis]|uniref:Voltage-gated potassium channel n=1 Tax=Flavobacterium arsenatis TaxID=1484332 RepID=A0ABU1TJN0_9FLAO|nr:ion transporter [Flavobacterium arsenatis]MDR6966041.1 voltage-gated potassium channel [Flavobacterium arsenatis]
MKNKDCKTPYDIFRQRVNIIIHGVNTPAGRLFDIILLFVILLSVFLVMLESVESLDIIYHDFFIISEWIITIFFSIEYILRIISSRKPLKYIFSFYGIIDLISILPMYLSFFIPSTKILTVVRALRLLRLFRILNLVQFSGQASQLKLAINASKTKIIVFIYFVFIISILLGAVMFVVESPESGFTSIPTSIYWCIVTLTTVGYGDIAPITPLGKIIASFIMILGYGIIAVPTGIVTAELASGRKTRTLLPGACKKCGTNDHRNTAEFCYKCGAFLEE